MNKFVLYVSGIVLTICAYSDSVPYYNKAAGPCLLVFGIIFAVSYILWKNFRRSSPEQQSNNNSGNTNEGYYGSNNNLNGRKGAAPAIIKIPAPEGSSAPAIQIQPPSVRAKNVHFKNNPASSTNVSNFLTVKSSSSSNVASSPVINIKSNGTRTRRNLNGGGGNEDIVNGSCTVEVDLHHIPSEPEPGPSGTSSNRQNGIYTIPTIPTVLDEDDDDF